MSVELLQGWLTSYGYCALFGALLFGIVGLPIPDETLLTLSGYLVYKGQFAFLPAVLTSFSGSVAGISVSYALGRTGGYGLLHKYGSKFHITEERLRRVDEWYERVGKWMLVIGYFIPGVRHLMAFVAGSSKMRYPIFAGFAYSGGIIWSLTFVSLGYYLGDSWSEIRNHRLAFAVIAAILFLVILTLWHLRSRSLLTKDS